MVEKIEKKYSTESEDLNLPPLEAMIFIPEKEIIYKILDDTINESSYWSLDNKIINPQPFEIKRRIFDNKDNWLLYELSTLKELNKLLEYNLHSNFSDGDKLRFLHSSNFDLKETVTLIKNTYLFKINYKEILLNPNETILKILNTGTIYINGRDADYRPIVIFDLKKYIFYSSKFELDSWLESIVFLCNYIINKLLLPGIVETWNIFLNLEGASMISVSGDLRVMISLMQNNFKGRLNQIYIFKMSMIFNFLLKIVFKMYPFVEKKLRIIDDENSSNFLFDNICADQIEKRFYGNKRSLDEIASGETYFPLKLFKIFPENSDINSSSEKIENTVKNDNNFNLNVGENKDENNCTHSYISRQNWELLNFVNFRERIVVDLNLNSSDINKAKNESILMESNNFSDFEYKFLVKIIGQKYYYLNSKRSYMIGDLRKDINITDITYKEKIRCIIELKNKQYVNIINISDFDNLINDKKENESLVKQIGNIDTNFTFNKTPYETLEESKINILNTNVNLNDNQSNISSMVEKVDVVVSKSKKFVLI